MSDLRLPPRLTIDLPLEGVGLIGFLAETPWLRTSDQFRRLPEILARLLDYLDRIDGEAA